MNDETRTLSEAEIRRGRRTLIGLAALFFVPLFAAFALYYSGGWRPAESANHGELLTPVPLDAPWALETWTLVHIADGVCEAPCQQALIVMRQTRLSLSDEMKRVERVLLETNGCCEREPIERLHPGLVIVDATEPAQRAVVDAFPTADRADSIYIVDPHGNLIMRFDARDNPKGLLSDLKKLLRLSHIG